jgi:hypothetical protein
MYEGWEGGEFSVRRGYGVGLLIVMQECKVEIRDNVVVVKEEGCKFASKALWEEGWRKVLCWGRRWRSEKRRNLGCSCWRELLSGWT